MKKNLSTILMLSLLMFFTNGFGKETLNQPSDSEKIHILASPEFEDLTNQWISGFQELHPEIRLSTSLTHKSDTFPLTENMILFSSQVHSTNTQKDDCWSMLIGHEAIVPIINSRNPFLPQLSKGGLMTSDFSLLFSANSKWSTVANSPATEAVNCYLPEDDRITSTIAVFLGENAPEMRAQRVPSSKELILKIQQDPYGIGFCRLADVIEFENNSFASQISILPIDKNQNGRLDHFENIYSTPESLIRGIWVGKYPQDLCRNVYAYTSSQPLNQSALIFLNWLNNKGQDYLTSVGLFKLSSREKSSNLLALSPPAPEAQQAISSSAAGNDWLLVTILLVVIIIGLYAIRRFRGKKHPTIDSEDIETTPAMNENTISAPAGLYYAKTHTWAFMEQDGLVKIGIDDFLQHITGTFTHVKTLSVGKKIRKGEKILTVIHQGKQLDLYSPISGIIRKQNQSLNENPDKINTSPYDDGWIYGVEPLNWYRETRFLLTVEKYKEWLEDEFIRLKDFLAKSANSNTVVFNHLILQDGGELTDNVLADLAPEVWEDFQVQFINKSK